MPRFPDGQQLPRREHPGRRARARPCRLLEEQSALRPLPRHGRRQHRRARGGARAAHPAGDRGGGPGARRGGARRGARPRVARRRERRAASPALPRVRAGEDGADRDRFSTALRPAPRRGREGEPVSRAAAHADPAACRVRPAVVHRALRARARAVGARHLPRGARRVAVLLPGVRLPDHERGLGLVLARAAAARGRLPAAAALSVGHQGALRRGAAVCLRRADRARRQSLPSRLHPLGAHRREARARARARGDARRGRLRLHPQLPGPRPGGEGGPVRLRGAARRRAARGEPRPGGDPRGDPRAEVQLRRAARRCDRAEERRHAGPYPRARERRPGPGRRPREKGARVHAPRLAARGSPAHGERARRTA